MKIKPLRRKNFDFLLSQYGYRTKAVRRASRSLSAGARYDAFIIWGNGLEHIPSIMSIIRDSDKFNIIRIVSKEIKNMRKFVKGVYSCDTVPYRHLVSKSKYLLDSPKNCVFILVENVHPQESLCGHGRFRHVQCENINEIKKLIRNKYNPRFKNPQKQIAPLKAGISHEHCIHATDYQLQVDYLLDFLGLESLDFYTRNEALPYYIPYHISLKPWPRVVEMVVSVDSLFANIIDCGFTKIVDTPHYAYLNGNVSEYTNYFYTNFGRKFQEDHFPEAFDKLIKNFRENYVRDDGKKSFPIIDENYVVYDGVHRVAILRMLGHREIKCIQIL